MSVLRRTDLETADIEGLWLEVLIAKTRSILLGTLYNPPNSSQYHDAEFVAKFQDILEMATVQGKEVIFMGDLNCNLLAKESIPAECKQLKFLFRDFNFAQLIKNPTRITVDSKTLLDVIATNCQSNVNMSGSASASLSDHDLVFCVRKLNCRKAAAQTRIFRSYANYDPRNSAKI